MRNEPTNISKKMLLQKKKQWIHCVYTVAYSLRHYLEEYPRWLAEERGAVLTSASHKHEKNNARTTFPERKTPDSLSSGGAAANSGLTWETMGIRATKRRTKNQTIVSTETETTFDKMHHLFIIINFKQIGFRRNISK